MAALIVDTPRGLKEVVGRELGVSAWFPISQERVRQFAEATEDRQWIHLDAERACSDSPYGAPIAHGFLTLSLISHLVQEVLQIAGGVRFAVNYGLNRVRFPAPAKVGTSIRSRVALAAFRDTPEFVEATFLVTIEGEALEKPHCVAEWVMRYYL
jgi:acyl dehydratase